MLKFQVKTFSMPGWIVPLVFLAALALIPFALMLAAGLAALGVGAVVLRGLLPDSGPRTKGDRLRGQGGNKISSGRGPVIDADYEVKGENEKSQHG